MKTAKVVVTSVEFTCPYCDETFPHTNGSLYWMVTEINVETLHCGNCNKTCAVPKSLKL